MAKCGICYENINQILHSCEICGLILCNNCAIESLKYADQSLVFNRMGKLVYCSLSCTYVYMLSNEYKLFMLCRGDFIYIGMRLIEKDQHKQVKRLNRKIRRIITYAKSILDFILINDLTNMVIEYVYNYF